jgi:hypothetical protein
VTRNRQVVDVKAGGNGFDSRRLHHYTCGIVTEIGDESPEKALGAHLVPTSSASARGVKG